MTSEGKISGRRVFICILAVVWTAAATLLWTIFGVGIADHQGSFSQLASTAMIASGCSFFAAGRFYQLASAP